MTLPIGVSRVLTPPHEDFIPLLITRIPLDGLSHIFARHPLKIQTLKIALILVRNFGNEFHPHLKVNFENMSE